MDVPNEQARAAESPLAAEIDVRAASGLVQRPDLAWIASRLRSAAEAAARRERIAIARLDVLVVDDAYMSRLHERHAGETGATDVLTFDAREDRSRPIDADIVICADEAARRAAEFSHSIERELLLYCLHGLLHCLGYDDHDEAGWKRMHAREDEILAEIGVGPVFDASRPAEGDRA